LCRCTDEAPGGTDELVDVWEQCREIGLIGWSRVHTVNDRIHQSSNHVVAETFSNELSNGCLRVDWPVLFIRKAIHRIVSKDCPQSLVVQTSRNAEHSGGYLSEPIDESDSGICSSRLNNVIIQTQFVDQIKSTAASNTYRLGSCIGNETIDGERRYCATPMWSSLHHRYGKSVRCKFAG
jgi:uncharacterized protein (DUF952 family)